MTQNQETTVSALKYEIAVDIEDTIRRSIAEIFSDQGPAAYSALPNLIEFCNMIENGNRGAILDELDLLTSAVLTSVYRQSVERISTIDDTPRPCDVIFREVYKPYDKGDHITRVREAVTGFSKTGVINDGDVVWLELFLNTFYDSIRHRIANLEKIQLGTVSDESRQVLRNLDELLCSYFPTYRLLGWDSLGLENLRTGLIHKLTSTDKDSEIVKSIVFDRIGFYTAGEKPKTLELRAKYDLDLADIIKIEKKALRKVASLTISRANGKDWDAHIAQYKKADDRAVKAYLELKNNTTFFSGQAGLIRAIAISRYVIEQDQDFVENPNPSNIDKERFKSEPYLSSMLDKVVGGEFYRLVNETYPGRFAGSSRVLARH